MNKPARAPKLPQTFKKTKTPQAESDPASPSPGSREAISVKLAKRTDSNYETVICFCWAVSPSRRARFTWLNKRSGLTAPLLNAT